MIDIAYGSPTGRRILAATVLGSGMAALDATVVNVALPAIGRDLGGGVGGLQWVIDGYLLTLAALILLGGSLGDRLGRRRVFGVGVVWFALASLLCGLAPSLPWLIAARALQGVGGALLTPGSLALIEASFLPRERAQAAAQPVRLGPVQRRQPGDLRRLRGAERRVVPAGGLPAAGARLPAGAGRRRRAAADRDHAAALAAHRRPGAADRPAAADDPRPAADRRRHAAAGAGRPAAPELPAGPAAGAGGLRAGAVADRG